MSVLANLSVGGLAVTLRRSERRSIGLKVTPAGLSVYAPRRVDEARLRQFIEERRNWAERHLAAMQRPAPPMLQDGFHLPYLGQTLTLRSVSGIRRAVRVADELHAPEGRLAAPTEAWYKSEALRVFPAIAEHYAAALGRGHPLAAVRLSNAASRWGSCTAAGVVRLHWRLSLAPLSVLHYVAAHEVAHLAELNHSPRYWAEVEKLMPEYRVPQRWLKVNGQALMDMWGAEGF
ncbi:SprT family zinc-dependent metalloprotease [Deinococcus sp.]|uniref:M48 family metallopeptidase n=1 Tax=Deinococcus sp. TaxID=47478 RepID=UPI0025CC29A5|nr:SprT family zinc-dependent metalloprotease [Deinococcus sp.]